MQKEEKLTFTERKLICWGKYLPKIFFVFRFSQKLLAETVIKFTSVQLMWKVLLPFDPTATLKYRHNSFQYMSSFTMYTYRLMVWNGDRTGQTDIPMQADSSSMRRRTEYFHSDQIQFSNVKCEFVYTFCTNSLLVLAELTEAS